jgi:tetratricopeptide (TPR) repeat protein
MDRRRWFYPLLLALTVLVTFGQVVGHDFLDWDDPTHLADNPHLMPASRRDCGYFWRQGYFGAYLPVAYSFWAAEASVSDWLAPGPDGTLNPAIFHAGSLALHVICVWLVFALLKRLGCQPLGALVGAFFFALHPLQVESVAWVSETRGLLASAFALLALCQFLDFSQAAPSAGKHSLSQYTLATVGFIVALLSKPTVAALPLVALAIHCHVAGRSNLRQVLLGLTPWVCASGVAMLIARALQPVDRHDFVTPVLERPLMAASSLAFYVYKLVVPFSFSPDYGLTPQWLLDQWWTLAVTGAVLLTFAIAWRFGRSSRAAIAVFGLALSPVLGFASFGYQDISTVADRYAYLALLGPGWLVAQWLSRPQPRPVIACVCSVLVALGLASRIQAGRWSDTQMLFEYTLAVNPASSVAHNNLGVALAREGNTHAAMAHFRQAIDTRPNNPEAMNNLGNAYAAEKRWHEAERQFRTALTWQPGFAPAWNNLGVVKKSHGSKSDAIDCFRKAIELNPGYADAHANLGDALAEQGALTEARTHFDAALMINPNHAHAHRSLGIAYLLTGNLPAAREHLTRARQLSPCDVLAAYSLGTCLAQQGRHTDAMAQYQDAIQLDPDCLEAHFNLSLVFDQLGDTAAAREQLQECLRIRPSFQEARQRLGATAGDTPRLR